MAKASFQWRYLTSLVQELPLLELRDALQQLPLPRWSGSGKWLVVTTGAVALLFWNGRLVLATGVGIAVMLLIYLMHDGKLNLPWAELRKLLNTVNQPLVLPIAGGGVAALATYLAASVWTDSASPWIAFAALLQGAGTLAVLILLSWQILQRQANHDHVSFNQVLSNLTDRDPLKRLIAVRHLTNTIPAIRDDEARRREISDYLRLMLSREEEPIVLEAVLDGLQLLNRGYRLNPATQPSVDVAAMKRSRTKVRRQVPVR